MTPVVVDDETGEVLEGSAFDSLERAFENAKGNPVYSYLYRGMWYPIGESECAGFAKCGYTVRSVRLIQMC